MKTIGKKIIQWHFWHVKKLNENKIEMHVVLSTSNVWRSLSTSLKTDEKAKKLYFWSSVDSMAFAQVYKQIRA